MKQAQTNQTQGKTQKYFSSYLECERYIESLGLFRMKPGLERATAMLTRLGLARPPFFTVQVVGTNGKGSTSTMLAELAGRHGLKTGLCTSPHFVSVRERIRVNGKMLAESDWARFGTQLMEYGGEELSYFEFVTCLAVLAFARQEVDFAVMETGLGGAYDATTALEADMVVFTPIDLDHQAVLGSDIATIAADKARAMRAGRPALSARQAPEAAEVLRKTANARQSPLFFVPAAGGDKAAPVRLRLAGEHQQDNAQVALVAWSKAKELLPAPALATVIRAAEASGAGCLEANALSLAWLPGRMQMLPPLTAGGMDFPSPLGWPPVLLDGAHNAHGLSALGLGLGRMGIAPGAVVFSCLADKDMESIIPLLRALATGPIFVPPIKDNPRSVEPAELARRIGLNAVPARSLAEALKAASTNMADRMPQVFADGQNCCNPLLVCGSLYLLGEFYALRPDALE